MHDETYTQLWKAFHPWPPAFGAMRADRGDWSLSHIGRELGRPVGQTRFLVMGTPGSGKTTELLRLAETRADSSFVVSLDLWRHFQDQMADASAIDRV